MEGARWNYTTHKLDHSKNKELYTDVPFLHLIPAISRKVPTKVWLFIDYLQNYSFIYYNIFREFMKLHCIRYYQEEEHYQQQVTQQILSYSLN